MTEAQRRKLTSIFSNGVEFHELRTEETEILADLYMDAIAKQTPKKLIPTETGMRYMNTYECPTCGGGISGDISNYCYHCGQKFVKENE